MANHEQRISEPYKRKPNLYLIDISQSESKWVKERDVCHSKQSVRMNETLYLLNTLFPIMFHLVRIFHSFQLQAFSLILFLKLIGRLVCVVDVLFSVFSPQVLFCLPRFRIIDHGNGKAVERCFFHLFLDCFGSHSFVAHIERKKTLIPIHLARGTKSTDFWFAPAPMLS